MNTSLLRLPVLLALLPALMAGCATSKATGATKASGTESKKASEPTSETTAPSATAKPAATESQPVTPRAKRLFEEAVAAPEEFKKLKVPVDWEVIERRWRAVLEAEELPEAWYNLGVVLEHRQQPGEARSAYGKALRLRPSFRQAAANLALLEEPSDPRQAAAAYQALLLKFPEDSVMRVRLATLYYAAGQHEEAWRLAREALMRDPKATSAYRVMMRVALERGNADLAELIALRAQKLGSQGQEAEFASFRGDIEAKRGDEAAAVVHYRKALALRTDEMSARLALLSISAKAENWAEVAEQARAFLQKDPENGKAHLALGIALRHQGKADEALAEYDKAEKLGGDKLPEVHLARGVAFMKLKNTCEPAIAEFKAYISSAGALAGNSSAFQLQRECEQILTANRQAEEAARQMQAEAEKKKTEEAAKAAAVPAPGPGTGPVKQTGPATTRGGKPAAATGKGKSVSPGKTPGGEEPEGGDDSGEAGDSK